ncbi:hypothetical protein K502DRAFT_365275 [Neoconidiobolus thromboides FSU 785]|nr:hypothetical protein K502DRAFT_365275 [Neoconidiobolus thromboides FSU 785]
MFYKKSPTLILKELADLVEIQRNKEKELKDKPSSNIREQLLVKNTTPKTNTLLERRSVSKELSLNTNNGKTNSNSTNSSNPRANRQSISWADAVSETFKNKRMTTNSNPGELTQKVKPILKTNGLTSPLNKPPLTPKEESTIFNSPLFSPINRSSMGRNPMLNNQSFNTPRRTNSDDVLRIVKGDDDTSFQTRRALRYSMGNLEIPKEAYLDKPVSTDSLSLTSPALIFFILGFIVPPLWLISSVYALPPNADHRKRRPSELALGFLSVTMIIVTMFCLTLALFGSRCWKWYYPQDYLYQC